MELFTSEKMLRAAFIVFAGYPLIVLSAKAAEHGVRKHYTDHSARLLKKTILYIGLTVLTVDLLRELDFKLTAILGSAGLVGIAVGFAFRTSVSNIISGLFMAFESPFVVGDFIQLEDMSGTVLSFDLLSVKIRAVDNSFIRIPNEKLLKSNVINRTRYPSRRVEITLGLSYQEDINRVREILENIATNYEHCLSDPEPMLRFDTFQESAVGMTFCVWAPTEKYQETKNALARIINETFIAENIAMPFKQITLQTDPVSGPLAIQVARR